MKLRTLRIHSTDKQAVPFRQPALFRTDPITRLWFLRAVDAAGLDRFGPSSDAMDDEVLAAIGFTRQPPSLSVRAVRQELRGTLARLRGLRPRGTVVRNVQRLARMTGLSALEQDLLLLMIRLHDPAFRVLQKNDVLEVWADLEKVCAGALAAPRVRVARALGADGLLRRAGLLRDRKHRYGHLPLGLGQHLEEALMRRHRGDDEFARALLPEAPRGRLCVGDYPALAEHIAVMGALVRRARRGAVGKRRAVHILLHGAPGTGKTELVRALAHAEGARLYEVTVTDGDGDAASRMERLAHLAMCQQLLQARPNALLVVDEAEDIFPAPAPVLWSLSKGASAENKGYMTRLLEDGRVPTLWITNNVSAVDEAFLRRFDLIVPVDGPRGDVRRRLVEREARKVTLPPEVVDGLVLETRLEPAMISRAVEVARVVAQDDPAPAGVRPDPARAVELVTSGFLRAKGETPRALKPGAAVPFDLALIHSTPSVEAVVTSIVQRRVARASLLLTGPPGTGKTELVRQLAARSGRPLVERKASDLLSKWVGDTEKLIAQMFSEARASGGLLFLDEAETFLSARSEAHAPWQIGQTNELLTRMAEHEGLFVCATNLVDKFDEAAFRRFDLKITFHPLAATQRRQLLQRAFADALAPAELTSLIERSGRLEGLCTGDVVAVRRGLVLSGESVGAVALTALLETEVMRRERRRTRAIGFA